MLDDQWAVIGLYLIIIGGFGTIVGVIRYFAEKIQAKRDEENGDDPYDF